MNSYYSTDQILWALMILFAMVFVSIVIGRAFLW